MNYDTLRDRYVQDAVSTASPATLLVMLYDRLVLDLLRAETALRDGKRDAANEQLAHAQDIISELANTLDVDVWEGATPAHVGLHVPAYLARRGKHRVRR